MASPLTASPRTRSRSDSSRDSTTRSASSSAAHTACATKNICDSRFSLACSPNSKTLQNHPHDFLKTHYFSAGDPVANGLVANLARPGGNITGLSWVSHEIAAKRLQLLKEIRLELSRVAFLFDPSNSNNALLLEQTEAAGQMLGIQIRPLEVRNLGDFDGVFQALARQRAGALIVAETALIYLRRREIAEFATATSLPTMGTFREFVNAGGLIAYGPNFLDMLRQVAVYVDKILRGAKPADLPIAQPTQLDLVINLKTAKALGLTIPQSLLLRADEVI